MIDKNTSLKEMSCASNIDGVEFQTKLHTKKKKYLKWGGSALLTMIVSWYIGCISFSLSYNDDPLVEKWDEYSMTGEEKIELIWDRVTSSDREPEEWPTIIEQVVRFFGLQSDDINRVKWQQTFRPFKNKKKVIHTQAAYGKIKWKPVKNNMGYTGLFEGDEVDGLVSYSLALDAKRGNVSAGVGLGVRLFRDNNVPASFVSMFPLPIYKLFTPLRAMYNIFGSGPMCTHISLFGGLALLIGARQTPTLGIPPRFAYRYPNSIGILNLANKTKTGETVLNPNTPFCICLRPNPELAELMKDQPPWDHPIDAMKNVPFNSLLYDVIAIDHPKALLDFKNINTNSVKVGEIWSNSEFVTSKWGDQMLFSTHQDWKLDVASRPDWKRSLDLRILLLEGWAYYSISPPKGPSARQFNELLYPAFATVFNFFTNPKNFLNFLCTDLGLCTLREALTSTAEAQNVRNMEQMHGFDSNEDVDECETESKECNLSGYDFFGYKSNSITEEWEKFLSTWFSIPPKSIYRKKDILSIIFAPVSPAIWHDFISENTKLMQQLLHNFEVEGHFLVPSTFTGLQQALTNPHIVTSLIFAVDHIIKPYNVNLPSNTIANIVHEFVALLLNPLKIQKLFDRINNFNSTSTPQ